jgi:hypothetical protein
MQEQLVSFEVSKLAKSKGYSVPYWGKDKYYTSRGELVNVRKLREFGMLESSYAPTQSILQRWLREVHKIHLVCWWYDRSDKFYTELGRKNNATIRVQTGDITKLFDTYELALEAGLLAALKLIK